MKKRANVERLLWKNFRVMIGLVFVGIIIPYLMIVGLSRYYENYKYKDLKSAQERMQDDYLKIQTEDITAKNGSAEIVTGDLQVVHLAGKPLFHDDELTKEQWSSFLQSSGKMDKVEYDIAYNAKEDFWLVVGMPVALMIRIDYTANTDAPENVNVLSWVIIIVISYFLIIGLCAAVYAKLMAKRLTKPIRELCDFTASLERGDYPSCQTDSELQEIQELQRGLTHLSGELRCHEQYRDEMEAQHRELVMEISHDLKNPLAGIQGYCEMLQGQTESPQNIPEEKKQKYLQLIHSNAVRANELLLSLFHYSQVESRNFHLTLKEENICEYVRRVIADFIPMIEEKGFLLEADIPEEELVCRIDIKMMHRVFENLFWNTLKYNPAGTQIKVHISAQNEKEVEIRVQDNGIGIPGEDVEKIFQPFQRVDNQVRNSREGGSGLGLAIVKRIIELHQGRISLQSDRQVGCTFLIHIPQI